MEIAKFKSHLFIALEQIHRYAQLTEKAFTRFRRIVAERVQDLRGKSGKFVEQLRVWRQGAMAFARPKLIYFGSQVLIVGKWAARSLEKSRHKLTAVGTGASNTLQKVRRLSGQNFRKIQATSYEAAVAAHGKVTQMGLQVSAATKQLVVPFQKAQAAIAGLGKSVADRPRKLRGARRARENEVWELLTNSPDAVVLTDTKKRLVAANPKALDLFGISETNLKNFTIDTFLAKNQLPKLEGNGSPSRDGERRSRCKIRRLDGGLQLAECVFVAHVLPHQHLYTFVNAAPYKIVPLGSHARDAAPPASKATEEQKEPLLRLGFY